MIELYLFGLYEAGTLTFHRFTSAPFDVVHAGETWTSESIQRGAISIDSAEFTVNLNVTVPANNTVARKILNEMPDYQTVLVVYRLNGQQDTQLWSGMVVNVEGSGPYIVLDCSQWISRRIQSAAKVRHQALCRHLLYGRGCGISRENFKVEGVIESLELNGLVISSSDLEDQLPSWYVGGVMWCNGAMRTITAASTGAVVIDKRISGLVPSDSFVVYAGCSHSVSECRDKFNNLDNFGGIPALPKLNPYSQSVAGGAD